jgi:RsiW-degrading membrane proteinase PrsW (M82 family)
METCSVLSLFPAPLVAIALYLLLRYKYPNGKFGLVHKTFLLGIAGVIPVILMDKMVILLHLDRLHSLNRTIFYAFILTGSVFEIWKFLVLKVVAYPSKHVTKTIDVIIYSLVIAAGFTTAYSVYALYYTPVLFNVCLYSITIGPVFVSISLIMGYFTGIALNREYPFIDLMTGLFLAIGFQGIYMFCLLTSDKLLLYLSTAGILIIGFTLLILCLRRTSESE